VRMMIVFGIENKVHLIRVSVVINRGIVAH
jgi:hypothetical protein